jgi:hypothetical protein
VSFALWLKTDRTDGEQTVIAQDGGGKHLNIILAKGVLRWEVGRDQSLYAEAPITPGRWHHVAGTHDFATGVSTIYVDGRLERQGSLIGEKDFSGNPVSLGSRPPPHPRQFFKGSLDDVRIYARALAPEEVKSLAQSSP